MPPENMKKVHLLNALNWEHPTSTLDIGTVSANVNGALKHALPDVKELVVSET
ncbi:hypothetical protein BGZ65_000216, partial [Modicella reniformis]